MIFTQFLTEERVGFVIGYTAAFVVDNFVKVSSIRYGYKILNWVASKTKVSQPSPQILFERAIDAVWDTF